MKTRIFFSVLILYISILALLVIPFGCGGSSTGGGGTGSGSVSGIVTNQNNEPIEGAVCSVNIESSPTQETLSKEKREESKAAYTATSDTAGKFMISDIPSGSWPMTITMTGYQIKTVTVNVSDGSVYDVPAEDTQITSQGPTPSPSISPSPSPTVVPESGTVKGRVLDIYGHPVANAIVVITTTSTAVYKGTYSSITDSAGYYSILNVPVGTWPMTITANGYDPINVNVTVNPGQTTNVPTSSTTASPSSGGGGGGGGGETAGTNYIIDYSYINPNLNPSHHIYSSFMAGTTVILGCNNGRIYRSTDSGDTFTIVSLSGISDISNAIFYGVWGSTAGGRWYAVGKDNNNASLALTSTDDGVTWTRIDSVTNANVTFYSVAGAATAGNKVYIVGSNMFSYYSADGNATFAGDTGHLPLTTLGKTFYGAYVTDDGANVSIVGEPDTASHAIFISGTPGGNLTQLQWDLMGGGVALDNTTLYTVNGYYQNGIGGNNIVAAAGAITSGGGSQYVYHRYINSARLTRKDVLATVGATIKGIALFSENNWLLVGGTAGARMFFAGTTNQLAGISVSSVGVFPYDTNSLLKRSVNTGSVFGSEGYNRRFDLDLGGTVITNSNYGNIANNYRRSNLSTIGSSGNILFTGGAVRAGDNKATVYRSADQGATWALANTNAPNSTLNDIYVIDDTKAFGVFNDGSGAMYTQGTNWAGSSASGANQLNCVRGYSDTSIYAGGMRGTGSVYKFDGDDWTEVADATLAEVKDVACIGSSDNVWFVTLKKPGGNNVWKYTGGAFNLAGISGVAGTTPEDNLYGIYASDASHIFIVGNNDAGVGVFYRTSDGGGSWTRVTKDSTDTNLPLLVAVSGVAGNSVYLAAADGSLYYYGGMSQALVKQDAGKVDCATGFNALCAYLPTKIFMVGNSDVILKGNN